MLGYDVGDKLLIDVVGRLRTALDEESSLFRIGGDEFCIIKPGYSDDAECLSICNSLIDKMSQPFSIDGHKLQVSQTIGISRFPEDGNTYEQLLTVADIAMFMGKKPGESQSNFKDGDFIAKMKRRFIVQNGLNQALAKREMYVLYQPKVDLSTHRVVGAEALVRWQHPEHGIINPDDFISVAEETHTVHLIDLYVLDLVCAQIAVWGDEALPVAVNFSPMLFSDESFADEVFEILESHGVPTHLIKLEITERTIVADSEIPLAICKKFTEAGIKISLDDFGSGYSSLSHMTDYPIAELKIDRSFTKRLCDNESTENTVKAIIGLAHASGMSVVAEGVETLEQYDRYRSLGCSQAQGYYIDRPLQSAEYSGRLTVENASI